MDKKGLIGKIFLVILVLLIVIIGLTAYQAYDLVSTISSQQAEVEKEVSALQIGDCSKISSIETRIIILESKVSSACKNPLISYSSKKVKELPANCENFKELKYQAEEALKLAKESCDIKILNNFTQAKINEYLLNVTSANYQNYAKMFNITIANQTEEEAIQTIKMYLENLN